MPRTLTTDVPVRALIFDMDGLLIDSEPVWFEVEGSVLAEYGHKWTRKEADACKGQGTPNTLRVWQRRYDLHLDIAAETTKIIDRMTARAGKIPLCDGVLELLETAVRLGLPMSVASSSPLGLIEAIVREKGLSGYFEALVSGQDVRRGKPAPDVFLEAGRRLGVPMTASVVFEDSLAGCRAGIAAGARVVAVPAEKRTWETSVATWTLSSLRSAIPIIKALSRRREDDGVGTGHASEVNRPSDDER